ncbi:prepilin-type N-terminal cleavage/methylation domain-containing protein [Klebsiella sp. RHBSTW-00484]|nr:prepilin-type N-terminal cleavage/methylation domain-containing protein [Klebsiella sp. RHBSTW-00465]QLO39946.1 prepilin-type N-terminal cleavage/methylation domain-containing protein [Klebsiella sp. RHBSTW-00484]QLT79464.1 prepilin-type N-terminal cleavage/methylation domain-containing protein [Klebsiella sp. RHBSTW-00464]
MDKQRGFTLIELMVIMYANLK